MKTNIDKNEPNIKQLAWDYILFDILTQDISLDVDNILLIVVSLLLSSKKAFFHYQFSFTVVFCFKHTLRSFYSSTNSCCAKSYNTQFSIS